MGRAEDATRMGMSHRNQSRWMLAWAWDSGIKMWAGSAEVSAMVGSPLPVGTEQAASSHTSPMSSFDTLAIFLR